MSTKRTHRGTRGHGRKYNRSGRKFIFNPTHDAVAFSGALEEARQSNPHGCCVSPQSPQDLRDAKMFLTQDKKTGFAILPDGDIVGVFNGNETKRGAVNAIMSQAVSEGGDRLDCYGIALATMYARNGFVPVARVPFAEEYVDKTPFNEFLLKERPDVFVMKYASGSVTMPDADTFATLPTMEYDDAMRYRDLQLDAR